MKPSTRKLWSFFIPDAPIAASLHFMLLGFLALGLPQEIQLVGVSFILAMAINGLLLPQTKLLLLAQLFPVTRRQAIAIPCIVWGLLWFAGLLGLLIGQIASHLLRHDFSFHLFVEYWRHALPLLTFGLFVFAINLHTNWFLSRPRFDQFFWWLMWGHWIYLRSSSEIHLWASRYGWYLFFTALLLLWTYPATWEAIRHRPLRKDAKRGQDSDEESYSFQRITGPFPLNPKVTLASILLRASLIFILFSVAEVSQLLAAVSRLRSLDAIRHQPVLLWLLLFLIGLAAERAWRARLNYREHRASGLSPLSAALLVLLRVTFVLVPLAPWLGAREGKLVRCSTCHGYKFVWQARCPFCQHSAVSAEDRARSTIFKFYGTENGDISPWFVYRILLPIGLLIIILMVQFG